MAAGGSGGIRLAIATPAAAASRGRPLTLRRRGCWWLTGYTERWPGVGVSPVVRTGARVQAALVQAQAETSAGGASAGTAALAQEQAALAPAQAELVQAAP